MVYVLIFAGAVLVTGMYACCVVAKQADEDMERMWQNKEQRLIDKEKTFETLSDYYHHRTEIQHIGLREALDRVPVEDTPHWTHVSDGEPTEDGEYLVIDSEYGYDVDTYYTHDGTEEYGWKQFKGWQGCPRVIAWMPFPTYPGYPKEGENE